MPGIDEIRTGYRVAVAPLRIVPQVKRINAFIWADVPAFGHARLGMPRLVKGREAFVQGVGDPPFELAGHRRRVEGLRLGAVEQNDIGSIQKAARNFAERGGGRSGRAGKIEMPG